MDKFRRLFREEVGACCVLVLLIFWSRICAHACDTLRIRTLLPPQSPRRSCLDASQQLTSGPNANLPKDAANWMIAIAVLYGHRSRQGPIRI